MNKVSKSLGVVAGFASMAIASGAHAAGSLTDAITEAATAAKTDIATAGGIIIGVVVAIAAVAWVRRVVK